MQLARAVRNRTTGVLYVLDEPSIGLHPYNIVGLTGVMRDLVADGNSVVLVDHDAQILSQADWIIEMGPGAGAEGGCVIAQGTVDALRRDANSQHRAVSRRFARALARTGAGGGHVCPGTRAPGDGRDSHGAAAKRGDSQGTPHGGDRGFRLAAKPR